MDERIIQFRLDDSDEIINFEVYDQVEYNGSKYLLVTEVEENPEAEEAQGVILKEINEVGNEIIYDLIDDEQEYLMVLELLRQNSDDYDLDYLKED